MLLNLLDRSLCDRGSLLLLRGRPVKAAILGDLWLWATDVLKVVFIFVGVLKRIVVLSDDSYLILRGITEHIIALRQDNRVGA